MYRSLIILLSLISSSTFAAGKAATVEDAYRFVARANEELKVALVEGQRTSWVNETYLTDDTDILASEAAAEINAVSTRLIKESAAFDKLKLPADLRRQIMLLRLLSTYPAPDDDKARRELADLGTELGSMYGKGQYCPPPPKPGQPAPACLHLDDLSKILATNRNYDAQLNAWRQWHAISPPMRDKFAREVELANAGARDIGFKDVGELWRAGYDMTPEAFAAETDRLWQQVKPLYDQLHCYVRGKLRQKYGADKVPAHGPIPAHLLGNMWAQEWNNIYDLVTPYPGEASPDVGPALVAQKYDAVRMVKLAESFFTSLGLDPLPDTFWTRSMLNRPRDREVVCHASAWDITYDNDLRVKVCLQPTEEDLVTIHHELGHDFYFQQYHTLPALFQAGANDGFHEGIGDTIALSVTPAYLNKVGLLKQPSKTDKALINEQMHSALDKVAFLPFGLLVDRWRWEVFSGKVKPADYNQRWWQLREQYQGVAAPIARDALAFDPGAKYHVAANVPYMRYFLARILQFQFHRGLCKAAGNTGPLYDCSIYGNQAAGEHLRAMLKLGASKPWPEALQAITGETAMDATALTDYYAPLQKWLQQQNAGQSCGW